MKNIFRLIDAICYTYDNPIFKPTKDDPSTPQNESVTWCNKAVNEVATALGYTKFKGKLANEIIDLLEKECETREWEKVEIGFSCVRVNEGNLVVAGLKNPGGHGHVCIVRPGNPDYSPKWNCGVPKVMNIGTDVFIDSNLAWAFGGKPNVYVWNGPSEN